MAGRKSATIWTDEERAAMQETARERKAASRRNPAAAREDGERDVLKKIAELPEDDRAMAERVHAIIAAAAPSLVPRTYYGMPAFANEHGKVVCFFTPAAKFKERYATLGFNADAHLDEGTMWPTSWALTKLTRANEARIAELVKKAAGGS
jgi:uncharacterized protein YdhG (YjbR/CyaY superfamily)